MHASRNTIETQSDTKGAKAWQQQTRTNGCRGIETCEMLHEIKTLDAPITPSRDVDDNKQLAMPQDSFQAGTYPLLLTIEELLHSCQWVVAQLKYRYNASL